MCNIRISAVVFDVRSMTFNFFPRWFRIFLSLSRVYVCVFGYVYLWTLFFLSLVHVARHFRIWKQFIHSSTRFIFFVVYLDFVIMRFFFLCLIHKVYSINGILWVRYYEKSWTNTLKTRAHTLAKASRMRLNKPRSDDMCGRVRVCSSCASANI